MYGKCELCPPPQRLNASFLPFWIQLIFINPIDPGALHPRKVPNIADIVRGKKKKSTKRIIGNFAASRLGEKNRNWVWQEKNNPEGNKLKNAALNNIFPFSLNGIFFLASSEDFFWV